MDLIDDCRTHGPPIGTTIASLSVHRSQHLRRCRRCNMQLYSLHIMPSLAATIYRSGELGRPTLTAARRVLRCRLRTRRRSRRRCERRWRVCSEATVVTWFR